MIEKLKGPDSEGYWLDEEGTSWDSPKSYLQIRILDLCGCGDPDEMTQWIKEQLLKIEDWKKPDKKPEEFVNDLPYDYMPRVFFLEWANHKNFAEHGSSIYWSWLTPLGEEVLKDIEKIQANGKED